MSEHVTKQIVIINFDTSIIANKGYALLYIPSAIHICMYMQCAHMYSTLYKCMYTYIYTYMYIVSKPGQSTLHPFLTEMGVRNVTVKRMPGVGTNSLKV